MNEKPSQKTADTVLLGAIELMLREQRRSRRWSILFRSLFLALGFSFLALWLFDGSDESGSEPRGPFTAIVELEGVIAVGSDANADKIIRGLRDAFGHSGTKGVILRINSPGGSPVQSAEINDEIQRLRRNHPNIPLYAVVSDLCASGGYYVAAAADRIYVNRSSLVGSIGVLFNGFGFVDALDKLGVERRLITAGEHKGLLDPFSPMQPSELAHLQGVLKELHAEFIRIVREGRGDRLGDDPQLFSGLIWSGEQAMKLGLVDGFGTADSIAREVIGAEKLRDFTPRADYWERVARQLGASMAQSMAAILGLQQGGLR